MIVATGNNNTYVTKISNHMDEIYSDTTESKGGSGKYFRPHDLIEAGFASCLNITTRMVLNSMGLAYETIMVHVELDRSDPSKSIFKYQIDIEGQLDEESKRAVLNKVMNCPVRKTLSKQLEFIDDINIR